VRMYTAAQSALTLAAFALMATACGANGTAPAPTLPTVAPTTAATSAPGTPQPPSTTEGTPSSTASDPEKAMLEYGQCMRDHGVDMPDPIATDTGIAMVSPRDDDAAAHADADAACAHFLDDYFADFELSPEQVAEARDRDLAFAQCMRDNGVDLPDPNPNGPTVIGPDFYDNVDPDVFQAALGVCNRQVDGSDSSGEATP